MTFILNQIEINAICRDCKSLLNLLVFVFVTFCIFHVLYFSRFVFFTVFYNKSNILLRFCVLNLRNFDIILRMF